jgi:hypothetical protein
MIEIGSQEHLTALTQAAPLLLDLERERLIAERAQLTGDDAGARQPII